MKYDAQKLLDLLPAIYRLKDAENGGALEGLLAVLAEQAQVVNQDIQGLYENWFIETCDEWVVPYIADLLGVRGLHTVDLQSFSNRASAANTLLYRQRKGTAAMLEQLARDTTGWPAKAVEFFQLLETTQYANHRRLANLRTPDLRGAANLELLDTPFDTIAHTADVRHIASGRGKHNIPNVGIFLWRLQSYFVRRSRASQAAMVNDGRYYFDPLGTGAPLVNRAHTVTGAASEGNVPGVLRRRPLYAELEKRRQDLVDGNDITPGFFNDSPPLQVWLDGVLVDPAEIAICDLADPQAPVPEGWYRPPQQKTYKIGGVGSPVIRNIRVGVDPLLGRIALPEGAPLPAALEVGYAYAFSGDVGSGPFNRRALLDEWIAKSGRRVSFQLGVTRNADTIAAAPDPAQLKSNLTGALTDWVAYAKGHANAFGLITILDSDTYVEDLNIDVPAGCALAIIAADWPVVTDALNVQRRIVGEYVPNGLRPLVRGTLVIQGDQGASKAEFVLDGVTLDGRITVGPGDLGLLRIGHATLALATAALPQRGSIVVDSLGTPGQDNAALKISIQRSICGFVSLADSVAGFDIADSIVSSGVAGVPAANAILATGATLNLQGSTVFGKTTVRSLDAGNSIFTGVVQVTRAQVGCVRFCHVPEFSQTPRRFRCQPDLAIQAEKDTSLHPRIRLRIFPTFTSRQWGSPGYAQLGRSCAPEVRTGAEDGAEMGVFWFLKQPQREANLRSSLDEYLRFGLEAGIFFVS